MSFMKRSNGVAFCALFIFVTSLIDLKTLTDARWYWHVFQFLPQDQITTRYIISLLGRIALVATAVGIWQLKNWGRLLGISLFLINIISLPWKHPALSIANSLTYQPLPKLDELILEINNLAIDFNSLTSVILQIWGFAINAVLIFFFTRKTVKKQFH